MEIRSDRILALDASGTKLWDGPVSADTLWPVNPVLGLDGTLYAGTNSIAAYKDGGIGRPTITKLSSSADPVESGSTFTLTAAETTDFLGSITAVDFYRDADGRLDAHFLSSPIIRV